MATFQVRCAVCRQWRWPDLPAMPARYVCVRCRMDTPDMKAQRQVRGQRLTETRLAKRRLGAQPDKPDTPA